MLRKINLFLVGKIELLVVIKYEGTHQIFVIEIHPGRRYSRETGNWCTGLWKDSEKLMKKEKIL